MHSDDVYMFTHTLIYIARERIEMIFFIKRNRNDDIHFHQNNGQGEKEKNAHTLTHMHACVHALTFTHPLLILSSPGLLAPKECKTVQTEICFSV